PNDVKIVEPLQRALPSRNARDQHPRPLAAAGLARDLQHQAALREHLEPAGPGRGDLLLSLAERDDVQPRAALEAIELRHVRVRLVDRLGPGERAAAEVDEVAAQAALHR